MVVSGGAFVLVSTRFVTFQLVTTVVLSVAVLVFLLPFAGLLAALDPRRPIRWVAVGLASLWLLPVVVPPYL